MTYKKGGLNSDKCNTERENRKYLKKIEGNEHERKILIERRNKRNEIQKQVKKRKI